LGKNAQPKQRRITIPLPKTPRLPNNKKRTRPTRHLPKRLHEKTMDVMVMVSGTVRGHFVVLSASSGQLGMPFLRVHKPFRIFPQG